ncbi:glycerophosphodiester phosphodiesterase family protein [Arthrobacter cheniae]|uniref:glycerophosphodiester phosphodiesterase family protein n=1 Tax=Arthrobacter cheniae TaxID=1258888 RepID=UPI001F17842B|nr:glycerophosphodiester phosphodiesterase family protein [Arthrobacter cheniae]
MTKTLVTAVAGLTLATIAPAGVAHAAPAERTNEVPVLIGHRGASGTAPENTVAAFKDGRASGADFFEIDVQLSSDGVPFLFHDDTPARTTDVEEVFPGRANNPVTSFTWAELQQLDAGSYFSDKYVGERIPHLDDAAQVATTQTGVYIEIKSPVYSPGIEQVVADELRNDPTWSRLVAAEKIQVLSFDEASNRRFAAIAPEIELQQLTGVVPTRAVVESWATFADSVGTDYRVLTPQNVADVKGAGLILGVYTVNSPEAVQYSLDLGVDAVTTDFPIENQRFLQGQPMFPGAGVEVTSSVNNPAGDDVQPENGEYVLLRNTSAASVDVSGAIIRDAASSILTVGDGYVLAPGAELRVYTGPGTNSAQAYYNGGSVSVLNNGGDSVALWIGTRLQDVFAN